MLRIFDNIVSKEENLYIHESLLRGKDYWYGEIDTAGCPPTGMIHNITDDGLMNRLKQIVFSCEDNLKNLSIQRSYINLFLPKENPYFHTDGNVITCLFYFNPEYDLNEGGETQFFIENNLTAVQCKPARLVIFDGNILHKATSFRNNPRITVAVKFNK